MASDLYNNMVAISVFNKTSFVNCKPFLIIYSSANNKPDVLNILINNEGIHIVVGFFKLEICFMYSKKLIAKIYQFSTLALS